MAFPMADLEGLVAAAKATVVDILAVVKHAKNIFEWAGVSVPFFSGPGGLKATPVADPVAAVQQICDLHKSGATTAGMAVSADWLSAIVALLKLIFDRWLNPAVPPAP